MDGEVIVLQAGDPWLTTSSLRTVGIFSDEEHFTEFTDKMLEKGIISDWGYKSLTGYYGMGRQCDIASHPDLSLLDNDDCERLQIIAVQLNEFIPILRDIMTKRVSLFANYQFPAF